MTVELNDVISRKSVYASRLRDDLVFFDEEAGLYFATGTVGADIWDIIETPQTIAFICAALMDRYEVDEEACFVEATRFVNELVDAGLAEIC